MIDLATEHLISLRDVPRYLPPRPNGKRVHISAVYRWVQKGSRNSRLEAIRIGGTTYSSLEALQRWADAITRNGKDSPAPVSRMTRTRQAKAWLAAEQVRNQLGIKQSTTNSPAIRHTPDAPSVQSANTRNFSSEQRLTGKPAVNNRTGNNPNPR